MRQSQMTTGAAGRRPVHLQRLAKDKASGYGGSQTVYVDLDRSGVLRRAGTQRGSAGQPRERPGPRGGCQDQSRGTGRCRSCDGPHRHVTTRIIPPGDSEFVGLFDSFTREAFQLETLQSYSAAGEDADLAAFLAGRPGPAVDEHEAWLSMVRRNTAAGREMMRAHVVVESLSPYMRYEVCWPYTVCTAAGEDVRLVVMPAAGWFSGFLGGDFWLFDSPRLYRQHHDDAGRYLGTEPIDDPSAVAWARRAREFACSAGVPWADYVEARPELAALPARVS